MTARSVARWALAGTGLTISILYCGAAFAQAPPEVQGQTFTGPSTLAWSATSGAVSYHIYRGLVSGLRDGIPGRCGSRGLRRTARSRCSMARSG